jgi:Holliday junction resolvasome RuvABC endonuclease subunit
MNIAGIDYSMTSPSICVHKGSKWSIENCTFHYIVSRDKHLVVTDQVKGSLHKEWNTSEQRFGNLATWSIDILNDAKVEDICLEGYAYGAGSKGLVFQIGENTGALKQKMFQMGIPFIVTPPTVIKKFATGKGNSNKEKMWDSFIEETGMNLFHILGQEEKKNFSPVSDMVDAYFLAKYKFEQNLETD